MSEDNFRRNIIIIFSIIIILLTATLVILFIKLENYNSKENGLYSIEEIIEYNKGLDYTMQIYNRCSTEQNASAQMYCVGNYLIENIEYVKRDEVYSIDDMFDLGADCKSYSIYYATLADMMGYEYSFFYTDKHVATLMVFEEGYCLLDGKFIICLNYENSFN